MKVRKLIWPRDRIDHIARHDIRPGEVEEVCFGHPLILRGQSAGRNPVYQVLGQTKDGRYLLCVVIGFPDSRGFPITARSMTEKEKLRFRQWMEK